MSRRRFFYFLILPILVSTSVSAFAQAPAPLHDQSAFDADANEQIIQIPGGPGLRERIQTTIYRPPGSGPFPLLIVNHGKDPGEPNVQPRDRFLHLARSFVQRGYAVMVPMRLGFAGSTGSSKFSGCDIAKTARDQAQDVADVLEFARSQSWVDSNRVVVAGQSLGGLVSLAFATKAHPGVRGIINFAGGLKVTGCDWHSSLRLALHEFGEQNLIPNLWLYGENDSLFAPDLVSQLFGAFEYAGGRARLFQYPSFKRDAHGMVTDRDGESVWRAQVESFLSAIGMPTQIVFELPPIKSPRETRFAPLQAVEAVPFLNGKGRAAYRTYLNNYLPRAFAISPNGEWAWSEGGEDSSAQALRACEANAKQRCQLYSVDQKVVWKAKKSLP